MKYRLRRHPCRPVHADTVHAQGAALETSTESLAANAAAFQRGAKHVRKRMWWNNFKMKLIIGGGATLFLIVILWASGAFSGGGDR